MTKHGAIELLKSLLIALVLAIVFRTCAYEPFHIPSGSMKPNLLVGDYIFVSKYSYGYSRYSLPFGLPLIPGRIFAQDPQRGDIIVFKLPSDPSTNYIKRLIGLPGDKVQLKNGIVYINRQKVERELLNEFFLDKDGEEDTPIAQYKEQLPNEAEYLVLDQSSDYGIDNTEEFVVPDRHYFFMGDNRDNSLDSRVAMPKGVGFVPEVNLVGRAEVILFTSDLSFTSLFKWIEKKSTGRNFSKI